MAIGLRPATTGVALHAPIALEYGTDPRISPHNVAALKPVSGETQAAIINLFKQTKKKATVIMLLDISGSMEGDKLKNAVEGTTNFMHRLEIDDEIYVYLFNDKTLRLYPGGRSGDVIEQLDLKLSEYSANSSTTLYDSICEAVNLSAQLKNADEIAGKKKAVWCGSSLGWNGHL